MKKIMLILWIIVLLFSVGCDKEEGPSVSLSESDIHTGTEGLSFEFGEKMPPRLVYATDIFPVSMEIKNKGAFDVKGGYLLLNIEKDILEFDLGDQKERIDLDGKSLSNPEGDEEFFRFNVVSRELGKETETLTTTILATLCYKYQTEFSGDVCVDTDFYNTREIEKACDAEDETFTSGQGGPIAVTRIESKILEDSGYIKPQFIIYLKNKGQGEVISQDSVDNACSDSTIDDNEINYLSVEVMLGDEKSELTCRPDKTKLRDGIETIRCSLEEGIDKNLQPYITILRVELNYGYIETKSKNVEIRGNI
tara:strand:+ start:325 stop:1251 length:927 start_codon:yes stop_codon:yes gene_type:complete